MKNKIAKAKSDIILNQPFFASLLLPMPIIEDNTVKTMATDGESIRYNNDWANSLSFTELAFVLAHETLHCVFQHTARRGNKNANRWNIAADYVINGALIEESDNYALKNSGVKLWSMPKGGLHDRALVKRGNGTAEGVYNLLPDSTESQSPGSPGGALDEVRDAGAHGVTDGQDKGGKPIAPDKATIAQKESAMRVKVTQAVNAAKMSGKMSQGLERLVSDLIKTRTDWRKILRDFINQKIKTEYSYAKPKRRFLADDIYLPSMIGEKLGSIVIAIDCSGSVNTRTLAFFESEINSIIEDCAPSEIKIIYFDSKVLREETIESDSKIKLKAIGGGGTDFAPIFSAIEKHDSAPIACVVLTDLEADSFGKAPDYPVLWANYGSQNNKAPFGEIVTIEQE